MTRILIADDHTMFRQGMQLLLDAQPECTVVATVRNGEEALSAMQQLQPDVVLMDINMPVLNGYETTLKASTEFPAIGIIALSMLADKMSVGKMLEAGAKGYLFKNADETELLTAIDHVRQGAYYVTPEMDPVLQDFLKRDKDRQRGYIKWETHPLSSRELDVLKGVIAGLTNQEIADNLFISNRTVDTHRKNILTKLQMKNTAMLVKYALENRSFLGLPE